MTCKLTQHVFLYVSTVNPYVLIMIIGLVLCCLLLGPDLCVLLLQLGLLLGLAAENAHDSVFRNGRFKVAVELPMMLQIHPQNVGSDPPSHST